MADCHLVAYRQASLNPVAITSRTLSRAQTVASRHQIPGVYDSLEGLLADPQVQIVDVAVPPDVQLSVIQRIVEYTRKTPGKIRGVLAQKPLGVNYQEAVQIVRLCQDAQIVLAVNQNMRYDQSVQAANGLLKWGTLGEPVLATIEMRAIPHWMPWQQRQGWVTLRIMSIHHLDTFRFWFGTPTRVYTSIRPDPRTQAQFSHSDGICLSILEYDSGLRCSSWDDVWTGPAREGAAADLGIRWRINGTQGIARGTIGWPNYPCRCPSTLDFTTVFQPSTWIEPRWEEVWFPDAFAGPMGELLCAVEENRPTELSGEDNLQTMALVDACYLSAEEHRAVEISEIVQSQSISKS